jgi:hypothetical protein
VTSSARHTVWSPSKDSTFEVRGEGPLAGPHPFGSRHTPETPAHAAAIVLLAHDKLVAGRAHMIAASAPFASCGLT